MGNDQSSSRRKSYGESGGFLIDNVCQNIVMPTSLFPRDDYDDNDDDDIRQRGRGRENGSSKRRARSRSRQRAAAGRRSMDEDDATEAGMEEVDYLDDESYTPKKDPYNRRSNGGQGYDSDGESLLSTEDHHLQRNGKYPDDNTYEDDGTMQDDESTLTGMPYSGRKNTGVGGMSKHSDRNGQGRNVMDDQSVGDSMVDGSLANSEGGSLGKPLLSSFARRCFFTKVGIGKATQHYEGLTLTGNMILMLAGAMKLKGCPTICDEDLRRVEGMFPNQFSRLPDELLLSSGWRRISKYCHFSHRPIPDGVPFFHSKERCHSNGGYYFLLASAVGMIRPIDIEPLSRDHLVVLETDFTDQCDKAPNDLISDPHQWTLVDKFCFYSGGPINIEEDVYYEANFEGNMIYMLAFLSPSLTPSELYRLEADDVERLKTVDAVHDVESVYDLTERDFDDLRLYHLGPCRALPLELLIPNSWANVLPPHFMEAREKALEYVMDIGGTMEQTQHLQLQQMHQHEQIRLQQEQHQNLDMQQQLAHEAKMQAHLNEQEMQVHLNEQEIQQQQLQIRQEQMRQEQMRQEQMRQEQVIQEQVIQDQMRQDQARQDQVRQEQMRQEQVRQEQVRQEQMRQEQMQQQMEMQRHQIEQSQHIELQRQQIEQDKINEEINRQHHDHQQRMNGNEIGYVELGRGIKDQQHHYSSGDMNDEFRMNHNKEDSSNQINSHPVAGNMAMYDSMPQQHQDQMNYPTQGPAPYYEQEQHQVDVGPSPPPYNPPHHQMVTPPFEGTSPPPQETPNFSQHGAPEQNMYNNGGIRSESPRPSGMRSQSPRPGVSGTPRNRYGHGETDNTRQVNGRYNGSHASTLRSDFENEGAFISNIDDSQPIDEALHFAQRSKCSSSPSPNTRNTKTPYRSPRLEYMDPEPGRIIASDEPGRITANSAQLYDDSPTGGTEINQEDLDITPESTNDRNVSYVNNEFSHENQVRQKILFEETSPAPQSSKFAPTDDYDYASDPDDDVGAQLSEVGQSNLSSFVPIGSQRQQQQQNLVRESERIRPASSASMTFHQAKNQVRSSSPSALSDGGGGGGNTGNDHGSSAAMRGAHLLLRRKRLRNRGNNSSGAPSSSLSVQSSPTSLKYNGFLSSPSSKTEADKSNVRQPAQSPDASYIKSQASSSFAFSYSPETESGVHDDDKESSIVSGASSALTDMSSGDRNSRRAMILQMAKARMKNKPILASTSGSENERATEGASSDAIRSSSQYDHGTAGGAINLDDVQEDVDFSEDLD